MERTQRVPASRASKLKTYFQYDNWQRKTGILIVAATFGFIGIYTLLGSRAAESVYRAVEAEQMKPGYGYFLSGIVYDSQASGGKAVSLGYPQLSIGTPIYNAPAISSLILQAKWQKTCNAAPVIAVELDNTKKAEVTLNSAGWAQYYVPLSLPAGNHTLSLRLANYTANTKCPKASIDKLTLMRQTGSSAPTVPGNLTASASSSTQVKLEWSASSDDGGVTGYRIYRNGSTSPVATTTATSYTDSGLSPNTAYSYTVSAYDAAGNFSATTAAVQVTTPAQPVPTPPPTPSPSPVIFQDNFDGPDGIITDETTWGSGSIKSPYWYIDSSNEVVRRKNNKAYFTEDQVRVPLKPSVLGNIPQAFRVEFDVTFEGWNHDPSGDTWGGIKLWAKRQVINGSTSANVDPGLVTVEFLRSEFNQIIQKKQAAQDDYVQLASNAQNSTVPQPGRTYRVAAEIRDSAASVSYKGYIDGKLVIQGTDDGSVMGPALLTKNTGNGVFTLGLRSDRVAWYADNFVITKLQ